MGPSSTDPSLPPHTRLVLAFIEAWNRNDMDGVMAFFAPDAVYHNMPVAPVQGTDAIRGVIESFAGMANAIEWIVHEVAENADGVVLTERTDRFQIGDQWVALPVMGAFEVAEERITAWRDYFDLAQFQSQLPKSA